MFWEIIIGEKILKFFIYFKAEDAQSKQKYKIQLFYFSIDIIKCDVAVYLLKLMLLYIVYLVWCYHSIVCSVYTSTCLI